MVLCKANHHNNYIRMNQNKRLTLAGVTASPYTQKMVAILRYRHIPYSVIWREPVDVCEEFNITKPKPTLLPTFFFPKQEGWDAVCDSTPIIRTLENSYSGRSVIPSDPALAFIDYLIEDFADEWCTKYMFHFRWYFEPDIDKAGTLLPLAKDVTLSAEQLAAQKEMFSNRQISRLYVVGSNDTTAPVIDASYRRFLQALETRLSEQQFMLGRRPGAGDFALFGQLTQLATFDPTPSAIADKLSPRVIAWVSQMYDQSGVEVDDADWMNLEEKSEGLRGLLNEIGRVYAPAQLANEAALQAGEKEWTSEIDGATWTQLTFPYQVKCLNWTREAYQALNEHDRSRVDQLIAGTGIESMLNSNT